MPVSPTEWIVLPHGRQSYQTGIGSCGGSNTMKEKITISGRQEAAAALLAAGHSVAHTARQCDTSTVTIWRWKKSAEFQQRIEEIRTQTTDRAVGRLAEMMAGKALDKLNDRLDRIDPKTKKPAANLDDIKAVFELFGGLKSNLELQQKLDRLLAQMEEDEHA